MVVMFVVGVAVAEARRRAAEGEIQNLARTVTLVQFLIFFFFDQSNHQAKSITALLWYQSHRHRH